MSTRGLGFLGSSPRSTASSCARKWAARSPRFTSRMARSSIRATFFSSSIRGRTRSSWPSRGPSFRQRPLALRSRTASLHVRNRFKKAVEIIMTTTGIEHVAPFAGLDATTFTVAPNAGTIFSGLPSLYSHEIEGVTASTVLNDLRKRLSVIQDAHVLTIPPPPVQGLGTAGGFKMMLQDRAGLGSNALARAAQTLVAAANKDPSFAGVFTLF